MKRLIGLVTVALGVGLVTAALVLVQGDISPSQAAGAAPVIVTNTPLPVTVTGTANVAGAVAQSGTWSVGISNALTSPVPVRDMDRAAIRTPFSLDIGALVVSQGLSGNATQDLSFVVPAGKGFVIEHLSASVSMPTGQRAHLQFAAQLTASPSTVFFNHYVVLEPQGTGPGGDSLVASTPFHAFVHGQMTLGVLLSRLASSDLGIASGVISLSGYLVDCGAGSGCSIP